MPSLLAWTEQVAGSIGILPPKTGHFYWLRLHRSEAAQCMEIADYEQLSREMGWEL